MLDASKINFFVGFITWTFSFVKPRRPDEILIAFESIPTALNAENEQSQVCINNLPTRAFIRASSGDIDARIRVRLVWELGAIGIEVDKCWVRIASFQKIFIRSIEPVEQRLFELIINSSKNAQRKFKKSKINVLLKDVYLKNQGLKYKEAC